ncbi:MAG: LamG domain-containing protein, partial [Akkermansiaceae bacterium]
MVKQTLFILGFAVSSCLADPSDNLLSYWSLDNNVNDSAPSGLSNDNGSWVGGSSYSSTDAQFGSSGDFNGSRYISIPSSSDLVRSGGSISISAWFKVGTWNTGWQALLSKGEGSNYRIARRAGDAQNLSYAGGSADIFGGAVNDGAWHHVVAVSAAGEATFLYIDGVEVATGIAPSLTDSGQPLLIGENPQATNRQWNGKIDDVAIFDAPLTEAQAKAVYDLGNDYGYPMSDVIQILDAHDNQGSVTIGSETWSYQATDTGSGTFILLGQDLSGVDVATGPSITQFGSSPIFITSGGSATLSWQVAPPFSAISIDNGVGNVLPNTDGSGAGSISVSPTVSTTYTITATNVDGDTLRSTTLFVDVDPSTPR